MVLLIVVNGVQHRRNASLSQGGVGEIRLPLCDDQDLQGRIHVAGSKQPGHAGADDGNVVIVLHGDNLPFHLQNFAGGAALHFLWVLYHIGKKFAIFLDFKGGWKFSANKLRLKQEDLPQTRLFIQTKICPR